MCNCNNWALIETAPMDGSNFLGIWYLDAKTCSYVSEYYFCDENNVFIDANSGAWVNNLTYWKPIGKLPEPPKEK